MTHIGAIRSIFVAIVAGLLVTHFILLILRVDRITMITFWVVSIPAFVAYGLSLIYFSGMGLLFVEQLHCYSRGMRYFSLAVIAGGSLWSQIALSGKFETDFEITYWQALLPFLVFVIIGAIIYIIALRWETENFRKNYKVFQKTSKKM